MKKYFLLLVAVLGTVIWAVLIEPNWIKTEYIAFDTEKMSPELPKVRLVHISDIHLQEYGNYEKKIVRKVNQLDADIIVITGDLFYTFMYFEGDIRRLKPVLNHVIEFLSGLHSKHGIYICRGNNDMSDQIENSNLFLHAMQDIGVHVLSNQSQLLTVKGQELFLAGVDFPEFGPGETAKFERLVHYNNTVLQSGPSNDNSYTHYYPAENAWQDYCFQGRMQITDPKGGIGITFYSHMHQGWDRFYRLRGSGEIPIHFAPHAAKLNGGPFETGVVPQTNRWYKFKIDIETRARRTVFKARVWPENQAEPSGWQAVAFDSSCNRISSGTVGLWSGAKGLHMFDDLLVTGADRDTLLWEDFEGTRQSFSRWVDWNYAHMAVPVLMQKAGPDVFTVLLSHTPDYVTVAKNCGTDLVLSGHTHGGQIRLPLFGAPVVRISLGRLYTRGFFQFGDTHLYVNRGLGTIFLPMRFLCRPEIAVFEIGGKE